MIDSPSAIPAAKSGNDTALIALGAALAETRAAIAAFRQDYPEASEEDREPVALCRDALLDAIAAMPAKTVDGLRIKAQALKAIYPDCSVFEVGGESTTDMRLASQIAEGLNRAA
jgi:hypothetical protein